MRQAASLFRRNRFARLFAVSKCAELLLDHAFEDEDGVIALRVESESTRLFDDLVETRGPARSFHGWQIKHQSTPLDGEVVAELLRALRDQEHLATGNIATSDAVPVTQAGHLRTLRDLCARLGADGAVIDDVLSATTDDERTWLQFAIDATGSEAAATSTLSRLRVHVIGDERTLEDRARAFLPGLYGPPIRTVLEALEAYVSSVDGTIEIDAAELRVRALAHLVAQARAVPQPTERRHRRAAYLNAVMKRYEDMSALGTIPGTGPTPTALLSQVYVPRRIRRWDSESRTLLDWIRLGTTQQGFLIVGEVGSGKSTLLQVTEAELAIEALTDERSPIPLLIRARDLKSSDALTGASGALGLPPEQLAELVADPLAKWIVLVDGADEVIGNIWTYIERLVGPLRKNEQLACLAVTTRPVVQPHHVPLDAITIEEWDEVSLEDFLQRWAKYEPDAVDALVSAPYYESLRQHLLLNPLMATLCVFISAAKRAVPVTRAKVFVEVVELLFEGWRQTRTSPPSITWQALRGPLARLSFDSLKTGSAILPTVLRDVLRAARSTPVLEASDEVQRELGLLVARADGSCDFVLRSFAEYLAAEHALAVRADLDALSREAWGEEIVRHALGLIAVDDHSQADTRISQLVGGEFAASAEPSRHLRPLLVALRTAVDLSGSSLECSERVAAAASAELLDEDSAWIGKRVASELRVHARTNSQVWQLAGC